MFPAFDGNLPGTVRGATNDSVDFGNAAIDRTNTVCGQTHRKLLIKANWLVKVCGSGAEGRVGSGVGGWHLGEQQFGPFDKTKQVVFGERAVELLRGKLVFAIFERQHVPLFTLPI